MRRKSESFGHFKHFDKLAGTNTGVKIQDVQMHEFAETKERLKILRSDIGGGYLSNESKASVADHGMKHQLTGAYNP